MSSHRCDQAPPITAQKYSGLSSPNGAASSATMARPSAEWVRVRWPKRRSSGTEINQNNRPILAGGRSMSGSTLATAASAQLTQSGG